MKKSLISEEVKALDRHDIMQILIGAAILSVPVGFTEETWKLGENLPIPNIIGLVALALIFLSVFTYFHYHKEHMHARPTRHLNEMAKRVLFTYIISFLVVALLLGIIQAAPWLTDPVLSIKRTVIVTFPSSMSAAIADIL